MKHTIHRLYDLRRVFNGEIQDYKLEHEILTDAVSATAETPLARAALQSCDLWLINLAIDDLEDRTFGNE